MSDYRLEVKVRNANILRAMEARGIESVSELCRLTGASQTELGKIINLKKAPITDSGDWRPDVLKVCEYLFVMPSDLFSSEQMEPLTTNKSSVDIGFDDISGMLADPTQCPSFRLEQQDLATAANSALEMLTEREKKILMLQFGIEGSEQTFVEISKQFGVTNQRIRQIAAKALRKLRHPSRSQPLLLAIDPEEFEKREERIRERSCN